MQNNSIIEPIPIYQAAEVRAITLRKLTVTSEAQAVQKVTMVMLDIIDRSFGRQRSKFGDWGGLLKTIRLAMQGRYLAGVEIFGICKDSRVLSLKISINWKTLSILAEGANFKPLDPATPPLQQVEEAISIIVSLLRHEVSNRRIDSFRTLFTLVSSTNDENLKRNRECGLTNIDGDDWNDLVQFRQKAIGHSISSEDVPGAMFRVLYVDSPIRIAKPGLLDRIKRLIG